MLTGAGISTDSGIPDFRGASGICTKDPAAEKLSTYQAYMANPELRRRSWQIRLSHPVRAGESDPALRLLRRDPQVCHGHVRPVLEPRVFEQAAAAEAGCELFREAAGCSTLHQLRHSALTHDAEDGASTPLLMTTGHSSIRSLAKYARPGTEALAAWQQQTDRTRKERD